MTGSRHEIDMTQGALMPALIKFSLPLILSGVLQLAFNAADLIVVGKYAGEVYLAAVGSNTALVSLLLNVMLGVCTGTSVMTARYFGAKEGESLKKMVHTSVLTGFAGGVIFAVLGIILAVPLLKLMGTPEEVLPLAAVYLRIYFAGLPVMQVYNFSAAILRAVGDTKRPLYYLTAAGVLNVGLNLVFVIVFKLNVAGVALATVISQLLSCALVVAALTKADGDYRLELKSLKPDAQSFKQILEIGIPAAIQSSMFSISNVLIQSSINSFGAMTMAGNTAAASIEGFIFVSLDAINQSSIASVSQNMGAKKPDRVVRAVRYCLLIEVVLSVTMGALIIIFSRPLLGFYTDEEAAIAAGITRMTIMGSFFFLNGMQHMMGGVMRSIGYSMLPTVVSLFGICGFRIVWLYTAFAANRTLQMLYISYPISWIITFSVHFILYLCLRKKAWERM